MLDSYYTPNDLAKELISLINKEEITSIVDFCVGEGRLLDAAQERWPTAQFFGTDICPKVIAKLKTKKEDWIVGKCDFLNIKSRSSSPVLNNRSFDLILSNPPFTCIGSSSRNILFEGKIFSVSNAMAFLVEAISYLSQDGIIYAILPEGLGYSEKDKEIREYLIEKYNFQIIGEKRKYTFDNCAPNIILVSINNWNNDCKQNNLSIDNSIDILSLKRGQIPMYKVIENTSSGFLDLIHTTNLQNGKITNLKYKVDISQSIINGPAVLIPRVGNPSLLKVCVIDENQQYAISDCIIAIETKTIEDAIDLQTLIISNWKTFSSLYKGTGARYITLSRLKKYLNIS